MIYFTKNLIDPLVKGTAFLGAGGGGDGLYGSYVLVHQLQESDHIPLISLKDLKEDDYVISLGGIGAPLVCLEKLPTSREIISLIEKIQDVYHQPPAALMATEIGGGNGLVPFYVAKKCGIPVFDGDLLGRAFPEVHMVSTNIFDVKIREAWVSDAFGTVHAIYPKDYQDFEFQARSLCVKFGSSAMLAFVLKASEMQQSVIEGSVSRAISIGHCQTPESLSQELGVIILGKGRIIDCPYKVEDGFLQGSVLIQTNEGKSLHIVLKNEFLKVTCGDQILALCPDIITLVDADTYEVIFSENLTIGQNVLVMCLRGPDVWYTPRGLEIIGDL